MSGLSWLRLHSAVPKVFWSSDNPFNFRPRPQTLLALIFGLIIFGLAEAVIIAAGIGVSPWTVLAQGISVQTGLSIGMTTFIVSITVLLAWIPLREKPGLGTILNAIIVSVMIDVALPFLPSPDSYFLSILLVALGVLLIGVGSAFYLTANLGPGARDGLATGLQKRTDIPIARIRTVIEASVLLVGWLLGGQVGLGTLMFALGVGAVVASGFTLVLIYENWRGKKLPDST